MKSDPFCLAAMTISAIVGAAGCFIIVATLAL